MATFQQTETVVCSLAVTDQDDVARDPATSMKIYIQDPNGTNVVDGEAMTKDSTGNYHYDYTPDADTTLGQYEVEYVATNGTRVSAQQDSFVLEARAT